MIDLSKMTTEMRNNATTNLDEKSAIEVITAMNNEDAKVHLAVAQQLDEIAKLVEVVAEAFKKNARLIYIGAGTSGRLGVLDAVECPPTFGVSDNCVVGLIAGGEKAFVKAVEGAEDDLELCQKDLKNINLCKDDIVVGIAASGRTPYVIGGLDYAKSIGCKVGSISCNANAEISKHADYVVEVVLGAEVLTGSTRLKAGTAQKMILNMITTAAMVLNGKAYQNLMVDVIQTNKKLETRAQNIVMEATGVDREVAQETLSQSEGSVKIAIVMLLTDCDVNCAKEKLETAGGHVRQAIIS